MVDCDIYGAEDSFFLCGCGFVAVINVSLPFFVYGALRTRGERVYDTRDVKRASDAGFRSVM